MNKTDDILARLQNQPQPTVDLPDELTDSIMSALPDRVTVVPKPRRRSRLYAISAISVAAGIALLLVLRFGNATEEPKQAHKGQPTVIQTARTVDHPAPSQASLSVSKADTPLTEGEGGVKSPSSEGEGAVKSPPSVGIRAVSLAQTTPASNGSPLVAATVPDSFPLVAATVPDGSPSGSPDSTAILTASIEAEMQQIRDDCYMERLSRTINNDPQLRRLVDDFFNEAAEEANPSVYVKQL